jgi:MscS family membrane protein
VSIEDETQHMQSFLQMQLAGIDGWRIAAFAGALLLALVAGRLARYALLRAADGLERRGRELSAVALRCVSRALGLVALTVGLYLGRAFVPLSAGVASWADAALRVLATVAVATTLYLLVDAVDHLLHRRASRSTSRLDDMLVPMVRTTLRVTIVLLSLLQIAQSLTDKPLTSILAGLGVGGLAVALAAQDTLKNFFGSMVIFADKPFQIGERVVVDGYDGVIEEVGFRSTRLRTLEGHLVTIPNGDLAGKYIRNISRRPHIRRLFELGLTYDTPPAQLERALALVGEILRDHEGLHPDFPPRVHFTEFKADSLNLQVIYWYHPADWWAYCAFSQRVNLEILRRFHEAGLSFAFPTQTIHLATEFDAQRRPPPPAGPGGPAAPIATES